ncbi:tRNA uridine-5-carboxymethylaminomethyl(34) synthesis GTPase MnmE [Francisellaceae bacterium]|nr:tRNA uridine-5-carboxymethylaminomethyl(34) synthesis GTPase MnmE [Francisellaceae bacterium]
MSYYRDTITAIATAPGKGGVGIVRVSGSQAWRIAKEMTNLALKPRYAHYTSIFAHEQNKLDEGIVIYFKAPHSFTGEDIVEFQGHGGPIILDLILQEVVRLGARIAEPGEFSQRAFLNDKMDLVQAEAIADMIDASSEQAAKSALKSLQGDFSNAINSLVEKLIHLRVYVEAAIDFPEEEIDLLSDAHIHDGYRKIIDELDEVLNKSQQGVLLREGIQVVIAGKPNAGKSSLLNALSGRESAIVTHIAGTTRDVLKESIQINGVPLHIIDTAGIRESDDIVENLGIERAIMAISEADHILMVCDLTDVDSNQPGKVLERLIPIEHKPRNAEITYVMNKVDLVSDDTAPKSKNTVYISAKNNEGIEALKSRILSSVGYQMNTEGVFTARTRHLKAIYIAKEHLANAADHLFNKDGELLAEELRLSQTALSQITGSFNADDLLGEIFSSFCIGK